MAGVAVLAGLYLVGNQAGRSLEPGGGPAAEVARDLSPPVTADPAADPVAQPRQVAAGAPVGVPGRPPLPRGSDGPHGSRRTTGADYAALTFDDGPDPQWTPEVLELLREYQVRATFCVVGVNVRAFPELIRAIADDGHTLCNHSWDHDFGLGLLPRSAIRKNLARTNDAIRAAAPGTQVSYYRQPGGAWTPAVVEVAEELGMTSLHWAVDPQDWRKPGAGAIASTVTSGTHLGAIVLLHDGGGERKDTVFALRTILPNLTRRLPLDAMPPGLPPPRWHGRELPLKPEQL